MDGLQVQLVVPGFAIPRGATDIPWPVASPAPKKWGSEKCFFAGIGI